MRTALCRPETLPGERLPSDTHGVRFTKAVPTHNCMCPNLLFSSRFVFCVYICVCVSSFSRKILTMLERTHVRWGAGFLFPPPPGARVLLHHLWGHPFFIHVSEMPRLWYSMSPYVPSRFLGFQFYYMVLSTAARHFNRSSFVCFNPWRSKCSCDLYSQISVHCSNVCGGLKYFPVVKSVTIFSYILK